MDVQATPAAQIPVFVNNRDRLESLSKLVCWLIGTGTKSITVLDNGSTYPPLLEWYKHKPDCVDVKFQANLGPWSFWKQGMHLSQSTAYVVTDADIVPSDCCPADLIRKLQSILASVPECEKAGPSLRLDNIPELSRDFIINGDGKGWEGEGLYWKRKHTSGAFLAPIDTTFGMYRAYAPWTEADWTWSPKNLRTDMPYVVEHTPWYVSKPFSEEEQYYRDHADRTWSHVTWPSPINS